jgi:hypothetical protein
MGYVNVRRSVLGLVNSLLAERRGMVGRKPDPAQRRIGLSRSYLSANRTNSPLVRLAQTRRARSKYMATRWARRGFRTEFGEVHPDARQPRLSQ